MSGFNTYICSVSGFNRKKVLEIKWKKKEKEKVDKIRQKIKR